MFDDTYFYVSIVFCFAFFEISNEYKEKIVSYFPWILTDSDDCCHFFWQLTNQYNYDVYPIEVIFSIFFVLQWKKPKILDQFHLIPLTLSIFWQLIFWPQNIIIYEYHFIIFRSWEHFDSKHIIKRIKNKYLRLCVSYSRGHFFHHLNQCSLECHSILWFLLVISQFICSLNANANNLSFLLKSNKNRKNDKKNASDVIIIFVQLLNWFYNIDLNAFHSVWTYFLLNFV